jgi:homoserine kinase
VSVRQATAAAPASVANVAVGFDILGHTIDGPGDMVTVRRVDAPGVRIVAIRGPAAGIPLEAAANTAGCALLSLIAALRLPFGFEIEIDKGIPLGSGLGGSAASAVAALVAAEALLDARLTREELFPHALEGEARASGARHGDNVGPQLLGGLVLAAGGRLITIPVPRGLTAVVVHPHLVLETRRAREVLTEPFALADVVKQTGSLALLITGCHQRDLDSIRLGLVDAMIEPRRAALIPGFASVKQAALDSGALGAGISGSGPSVFAWCEGRLAADRAGEAMRRAFAEAGHASDVFVSPLPGPRAERIA